LLVPARAVENAHVAPPGGFQALIDKARRGDRQALDEILQCVRPHMEAVARAYADPARATESTSDLVQEAWLRAWQKLDQFEGGTDDEATLAMFHGWVGQIVSRLGLNMRRDQRALKRRPEGGAVLSIERDAAHGSSEGSGIHLADSGTSPSSLARQGEEETLVREAIDRVPDPTDRAILRFRFFEGVSLREISARLSIDYNEVRERYALALVKLENALAGLV
jgi:RNA polymerase sigma factor (sigma-70 family)